MYILNRIKKCCTIYVCILVCDVAAAATAAEETFYNLLDVVYESGIVRLRTVGTIGIVYTVCRENCGKLEGGAEDPLTDFDLSA